MFTRGGDLYLAGIDGRKLASHAKQAAVAPDGRRIAFVRDDSIWTMKRDGSSLRRITSGEDDVGPSLAPNGNTLYFSRRLTGKDSAGGYVYAFAIFRMQADGSGVTQLTHPELEDHGVCHVSPAPSPDGQLIAFADFVDCDHGADPVISAIDLHGREATIAEFDVGSVGTAWDPAWSPDGTFIAFAATDDYYEPTGIHVASTSGSPATPVSTGRSEDPDWSSDGSWIALVASEDIWIVRPDGTGLLNLTKTRAEESEPAWLPEQ